MSTSSRLNPDTSTLHPLADRRFEDGPIYTLANDSAEVFCAGSGGKIRHIAADHSVRELAQLKHSIFCLTLSPDGRRLLAGGAKGRLDLLEIPLPGPTSKITESKADTQNSQGAHTSATYQHGGGAIFSACFDAKRRQIICAATDGTLTFLHADGLMPDLIAQLQQAPIRQIKILAGGDELLVCGAAGLLCSIDLNERRRVWTAHATKKNTVFFDAIEDRHGRILVASKDGSITAFDRNKMKFSQVYQHSSAVNALLELRIDSNSCLVAGTRDAAILLLDCFPPDDKQKNHVMYQNKVHDHSVNALAIAADVVISAGDDGRVKFWKYTP